MCYILVAPISNSNCNANFCFLSLHSGKKLTFWLKVTRYLEGGRACSFHKKGLFSRKNWTYKFGLWKGGLGSDSAPSLLPHPLCIFCSDSAPLGVGGGGKQCCIICKCKGNWLYVMITVIEKNVSSYIMVIAEIFLISFTNCN
jgi:hypothetical protein